MFKFYHKTVRFFDSGLHHGFHLAWFRYDVPSKFGVPVKKMMKDVETTSWCLHQQMDKEKQDRCIDPWFRSIRFATNPHFVRQRLEEKKNKKVNWNGKNDQNFGVNMKKEDLELQKNHC